jgi:hypothetical protein
MTTYESCSSNELGICGCFQLTLKRKCDSHSQHKYFNQLSTNEFHYHYCCWNTLMQEIMKGIIFWDMMPCSPLSCNRRFGGTYHLHLPCRRIIPARTSRQVASRIIFQPENPEDGGDMFLRNVGSNSTDYTASYPRR